MKSDAKTKIDVKGIKHSITSVNRYIFFIVLLVCIFTISISAQEGFWIKSGLDSNDVWYFTTGPDSSLFAGVYLPGVPQNFTVYRSTNAGSSWIELTNGLPQQYLLDELFSDSTNYVFLGIDSSLHRLYKTDSTWMKILSFGSGNTPTSLVATSKGLIFAGDYGGEIYKSTNYGDSWQISYYPQYSEQKAISLAILKNGNIIASTRNFWGDAWIIRSTNTGLSWEMINDVFSQSFITLKVNPITGSLWGISDWNRKLFHSTDEGVTWKLTASPLNGTDLTSIAFDSFGNLYACGLGVYVSSNDGSNFIDITNNLPWPTGVKSITVGVDNHIYLGTLDGVWKTSEEVTEVTDEYYNNNAIQFSLHQNYPNPFNPTTMIEYDLPVSGYVKINVLDILGREIAILVNDYAPAGRHKVTFDADGLTSGIYFYHMQTDNFRQTRKFVLLK